MAELYSEDFNEYISIKNLSGEDIDTDLYDGCDKDKPCVIKINDCFDFDKPLI